MRNIDCKNLACPKPVITLKKLLEEGCTEALRVEVDNLAAKENVLRFLTSQGVEIEGIKESEGIYTIVSKGISGEAAPAKAPVTPTEASAEGVTYIIDKDSIGKGDEELGKKLLVAFQNTLPDYDHKPKTLFFMNKGVFFALEDSPTLEALKKLETTGVEIIVCGTCTNFFEVTERVSVGILGNMYDLIDLYNRNKVVTL